MGIRFICERCYKHLNVKASQAGQTGECPFCRRSILVPNTSSASDEEGTGSESEIIESVFQVDKQISQAGLNSAITLEDVGSKENLKSFSIPYTPSEPATIEPDNPAESFLLGKPLPPSTLGKIDPIAEAPRRIWYFRSKKIGEKGPLKAKAMQEYLDKGDVTIGCIVWREDWEDWQPAEAVFPKLVALVKERENNEMIRNSSYQIPDELNPHSAQQKKKRLMKVLGIVAIAFGIVTICVLVMFLIRLVSS